MNETINGVPLELLKRAVQIPSKASVEENHAAIVDRGRAQAGLRDMLNAVPVSEAKAQVYEPLVCDYCNAETQDPWHGSGMLNGVESRHIHACSQCRNLLPTTKAQGVVMPAELDRAFITGESCDGVYRVAIQSETLKEMQAVHNWLARINAAPAAPAADAWIQVSERLPEPNTKVLVHGPKCKHFFALRKNRQRNFWEFLDGNTCNEKITHWTPLPAEPAAHSAKGVV